MHLVKSVLIFLFKFLSILCGLAFIYISILPFGLIKKWGDHFANDGNFESLQIGLFNGIRGPLFVFGAFVFCFGLVIWLKNDQFNICFIRLAKWLKRNYKVYMLDMVGFFISFRKNLPPKKEWKYLFPVLFFATAYRIGLLFRPLEYDEAYTYVEFARHSFSYIISEYYVVNNHIFHTLLVKMATTFLGEQPWVIRLPVFLAGLLTIFFAYILAKKFFGFRSALLTSILISFTPILLDKSASARGYMIITGLFVSCLLLALYLNQHKNLFGWSILSLLIAFGVFTNPVMLYPFCILYSWLFLQGQFQLISPEYLNSKQWLLYLAGSSGLAGLLSVVFYSQIFKNYGFLTVFSTNQVVESIPLSRFIRDLPTFFRDIRIEWKTGLSFFMIYLFGIGLLFSFIFYKKYATKKKISIISTTILVWIVLVMVQRPTVIPRIWLWLIPIVLFGAASGLVGFIDFITRRQKNQIMANILFCLITATSFYYAIDFVFINPFQREDDTPIIITRFLESTLTDQDIVAVSMDSDARFWYYFNLFQIPQNTIRGIKIRPFETVYIIVNPNHAENFDSVLSEFGPDRVFLDLSTTKKIFHYLETDVYSISANPEVIKAQFEDLTQ